MIDGAQTISALSFTRSTGAGESVGLDSLTQSRAPLAAANTGQGDFQTTLASMAGDMVQDLRKAETVSLDALAGKADTREVVDAVMTAEQTLQTAIAIRDKIVTAYLEISRMQI